jgi:flagellar biosynthesis chaperone FliJ
MAIKKPTYRYQFKPEAISYFKPNLGQKQDLAKSVGTQVTNLEKRFQAVGIPTETGKNEVDQRNIIEKALNLKADQNVLMDILEVMNRPTQVVTNILSSLGDQDKRDVLTAAWEGLSGQKEIGARQALVNLTGDKNLLKIKEDNKSYWDDVGQFVIDLGLEIGLDPTTYITAGMSKSIRSGIGKAGKAVSNAADNFIKQTTMSTLRGLAPVKRQAAMGFLRGVRNVVTKTGYLFDAMKDISKALRFELDKIFSKSTASLTILKSGVKSVDNGVEKLVKEYAEVVEKGFDPKSVDVARETLSKSEKSIPTLQEAVEKANAQVLDSAKKLESIQVPWKKNKKQYAALKEKYTRANELARKRLASAEDALKGGKSAIVEAQLAYEKLEGIGRLGAKEYYRKAIFDLYEAGFKFDDTGKLIKEAIPQGRISFDNVLQDLKRSEGGFTFKSREMSRENVERVMGELKRIFDPINEGLKGGVLKTSRIGNFITISVQYGDEVTSIADDVARKAQKDEILTKIQSKFDSLAGETGPLTLTTGEIILTQEMRDLLGRGKEVKDIFDKIDNVMEAADEFMGTTTSGFKYKKSQLFKGELPEGMRYARRVRTQEFIKRLKTTNKYDALPALKEVVSSTGRELEERVYRGTAREFNKLRRLMFEDTIDEFSEDIIESMKDYIRVAESRFSASEITRIVFGIDAVDVVDEDKLAKAVDDAYEKASKKGTAISKESIREDLLDTGAFTKQELTPGQEFSQAEQFLKPVGALSDDAVVSNQMAQDFLKTNPQFRILDDGFIYFDDAGKVGGEFKTLYQSLPKNLQEAVSEYLGVNKMLGKKMAVHRNIYDMLKGAQNAYTVNLNEGVKLFDKMLGLWKEITLISPAFHLRNFTGNWSNMWLAGMGNGEIIENTAEAMRQLSKRDELIRKLTDGTITAQEKILLQTDEALITSLSSSRGGFRDLDELIAARRFSPDIDKKLGGGFKEGYRKIVDANFKLSQRADEIQRLALFNWHKKKGLSSAEALQKVREVLFDYGKLTPFEKTYMKRFFPFYTFMKENLVFQFKNLLEKPGRYKNLFRTYKHYTEGMLDVDAKDLPKYMTGNFWLPMPFMLNKDDKDSIAFLKANLPASDFLEFVEDPLKKTTSSIAVPIKSTWEFLSGVDTFTGAPIQKFAGEKSLYKGPESVVGFLRNEKGEFDISKDPVLKKFADDLGLRTVRRPLTLLLDSIDAIFGKQDPGNFALDILEQSGYVTTKSREQININALYQQLEYLRKMKQLYEQNTGKDLPTIRQLDQRFGYKFKG